MYLMHISSPMAGLTCIQREIIKPNISSYTSKNIPFYQWIMAIHARESRSRALCHLRPSQWGHSQHLFGPAFGSHLGQWALILRMPCTLVLTYYLRNTHKLFKKKSGSKAHLPWLPKRERERERVRVWRDIIYKVYIVRLEHSSDALF
jgi:hypothetical protein